MSDVAVLVIDMLNTYRHENAELLAPNVAEIVDPLVGLISRARQSDDVDLIYVNDNDGDFNADFRDVVDAALHGERPDLVTPIRRTKTASGCSRCGIARSTPARWAICSPARDPPADHHRSGHRAVHPLHRA